METSHRYNNLDNHLLLHAKEKIYMLGSRDCRGVSLNSVSVTRFLISQKIRI